MNALASTGQTSTDCRPNSALSFSVSGATKKNQNDAMDMVDGTSAYSIGEQRWLHATEIREFLRLGIVPRQYSTGGKAKLFGIGKRGQEYLRMILIHGARAAVLHIKRDRAPIGAWLKIAAVPREGRELARLSSAERCSGLHYAG